MYIYTEENKFSTLVVNVKISRHVKSDSKSLCLNSLYGNSANSFCKHFDFSAKYLDLKAKY